MGKSKEQKQRERDLRDLKDYTDKLLDARAEIAAEQATRTTRLLKRLREKGVELPEAAGRLIYRDAAPPRTTFDVGGMKIEIRSDPTMPEDELEVRSSADRVRITGLAPGAEARAGQGLLRELMHRLSGSRYTFCLVCGCDSPGHSDSCPVPRARTLLEGK